MDSQRALVGVAAFVLTAAHLPLCLIVTQPSRAPPERSAAAPVRSPPQSTPAIPLRGSDSPSPRTSNSPEPRRGPHLLADPRRRGSPSRRQRAVCAHAAGGLRAALAWWWSR